MNATQIMRLSCPHCAARMPETAAFCPGCGMSMREPERAKGRVAIFPERIAGALAYITFVPAIIFLVLRPYSRNLFVRFHTVQCLLFCGATTFLATLIRIAAFGLGMIPIAGALIVVLIYAVATLAAVLMWVVLVLKALQGQMFKLSYLGDFAEKYANVP